MTTLIGLLESCRGLWRCYISFLLLNIDVYRDVYCRESLVRTATFDSGEAFDILRME